METINHPNIDQARPDIVHFEGNNIMVGNESRILTHCVNRMYNRKDPGIYIEDWVWIGFRAIILPGVRIRRGSVIGAGSVVCGNTFPYSINAGNPCDFIRTRSGLELINYRSIRKMHETMGRVEPDYSVLEASDLFEIFDMPRSKLPLPGDPAHGIYRFLYEQTKMEYNPFLNDTVQQDISALTVQDFLNVYEKEYK